MFIPSTVLLKSDEQSKEVLRVCGVRGTAVPLLHAVLACTQHPLAFSLLFPFVRLSTVVTSLAGSWPFFLSASIWLGIKMMLLVDYVSYTLVGSEQGLKQNCVVVFLDHPLSNSPTPKTFPQRPLGLGLFA